MTVQRTRTKKGLESWVLWRFQPYLNTSSNAQLQPLVKREAGKARGIVPWVGSAGRSKITRKDEDPGDINH